MVSRNWARTGRWALLLLAIATLAPGRARAQQEGPPPGGEAGKEAQDLDFEEFDALNRKGRAAVREQGPYDPSLHDGRKQMNQLGLVESQKAWGKRKKKPKTLKKPERFFFPALSGATGLLDMPSGFSLAAKQWMMNLRTEHLQADATYWPLVYTAVHNDSRYLTVAVGATDEVELSLSLESWDRTIVYNNPLLNTTGPVFSETGKFIYGYGVKWSIPLPYEDLWFALGGRFQFFGNDDRAVIELHEYDRIQNVYAVVSGQATRDLWGHAMYKYISYDLRGGLSPSGVTTTFPGFSPTNFWGQLGLGFEYFLFPNFEILGELTKDTDIIFLGGVNQIRANAGARYLARNVAFEFWAKNLNWKGLTDNGVSIGWRF